MKKKSIVTISVIIISILLGLNIYMYLKSYKISQYAYESNLNTESIVLIDKFRTNINRMAQAQKLYLVTAKEEYRNNYEQNLQKIYSTINELESSGSLTGAEKQELIMVVEEYSNMEKDMMNLINKQIIGADLEKAIVQSNQAQLNILRQLDNSVEKTKDNAIQQNETMVSQTNLQKNGIQIISTFFTVMSSTFLYYAKKNPTKFGGKIGKIIYCISNTIEPDKKIEKEIKDIEKEIIKIEKGNNESKKCMKDLLNHEKNLEGIKLINMEANNIREKLKEADEIITKIDFQIKKLIIDIEEIKECSSQIQGEKIRNIEYEMIELRILFETLPIYSNIILDISTNIKNNNNVENL
ncbi:CHASE3 domain-containing protein [Romboutsia sp.]|uniref:CHASE3 domain-containing protein n=1 Tax=Romboutsia sp. TaxID=1965302 RepID=UPI003F2D6EAD